MEQHYTDFSLLKYLYRETSLTTTLEIEDAIENDDNVRDRFQELKSSFKQLPKVLFYPTDNTMSKIMDYSARTAAVNTSH